MSDREKLDGSAPKPPTMRDVALKCGVSQATVSMALRNDKRLDKSTVERVAQAAREMGYDPMRYMAARRLISRRHGQDVLNHIIGMFFYHKDFGESNYFVRILQGILKTITEVEFEIQTSDTQLTDPQTLPGAYRRGDVDGALVMSQQSGFAPILRELRAEPSFGKRPVIGLIEHMEGCAGVFPDNHQAGYLAISHLLELGHKRIIVNGPSGHDYPFDVLDQRYAAYEKACAERGYDPKKCLVPIMWDTGAPDASFSRLTTAMRENPDVTGIISSNDLDAAAMYDFLSGQGIRIPTDLSLVSYDDTDPIVGPHRVNILTSVKLPLKEIGREGARMLIRRIQREETEDRDIILPVELMLRESTAPPKRTGSS